MLIYSFNIEEVEYNFKKMIKFSFKIKKMKIQTEFFNF